jgi:hypothetical protein
MGAATRGRTDRCGDCLLYTTPYCVYAHVHDLILERDVACASFYPLAKRLDHVHRRVATQKQFTWAVECL